MKEIIKPGPHLFPKNTPNMPQMDGRADSPEPNGVNDSVDFDVPESMDGRSVMESGSDEPEVKVVDDGLRATIKFTNAERGYAFAMLSDGRRVFVHVSSIIDYPVLRDGGILPNGDKEIFVGDVLTEESASRYGVQLPLSGEAVVLYRLTADENRGGRLRAAACMSEVAHTKMIEQMNRNKKGIHYGYWIEIIQTSGLSPKRDTRDAKEIVGDYKMRHGLIADSYYNVPRELEVMCLADEHGLSVVTGEDVLRQDLLWYIETRRANLQSVFEQISTFPELIDSLEIKLDEMGNGCVKMLGKEIEFKRWGLNFDTRGQKWVNEHGTYIPVDDSLEQLVLSIFANHQTIFDGVMDVRVLLDYCIKHWLQEYKFATDGVELHDAILYRYVRSLSNRQRQEWEEVLRAHDDHRNASETTAESLFVKLAEIPKSINIVPVETEIKQPYDSIESDPDVNIMNALLHRLGIEMQVSTDSGHTVATSLGFEYLSDDEMGTRYSPDRLSYIYRDDIGTKRLAYDVTPHDLLYGITRRGGRYGTVDEGPIALSLGVSLATLKTVRAWYEARKLGNAGSVIQDDRALMRTGSDIGDSSKTDAGNRNKTSGSGDGGSRAEDVESGDSAAPGQGLAVALEALMRHFNNR